MIAAALPLNPDADVTGIIAPTTEFAAGFTAIDNRFIERMPSLSPVAVKVYLALARRGRSCWPSLSRLQADTGLARATVVKAIVELKAAGCIAVTAGTRQSHTYALLPMPTGSNAELVHGLNRTGSRIEPHRFKRRTSTSSRIEPKQEQVNKNQEEHSGNKGRGRKRTAFTPPSLDEVVLFCGERKNTIDPEHFITHYTANGWKQGNGRPIVDWKAAVITWEKNERKFAHGNGKSSRHNDGGAPDPGTKVLSLAGAVGRV
jgi:hypothetical protein